MAENLMEDIIIDILWRLPVKSLMRFKCKSKQWRSLISDQHFARLHLQRLILENIAPSRKIIKSNPLQTIGYEALDNDEVNDHAVVEYHDLGRDERLAGSCHGLMSLAIGDGFLVTSFEAWIMNEYGKRESWTRSFSVLIDGLLTCQLYTIPSAYTRSGKIVFQIDVSEMILFNPEDGTYNNYPIDKGHNVESAIYVETLVSPYVGHEQMKVQALRLLV
ncbi:uncharacterized protein LOC125314572 [Rhodamnia argentea]|uniref:Uncharacterized protein LOC125314572 n=1 Tax=Rhodamnia argentea TaxID=178133 RepID=A0ABM3H919_9MYRT|nr:uncharacterized protein LOC125314572 [Rhodamnia argentea]